MGYSKNEVIKDIKEAITSSLHSHGKIVSDWVIYCKLDKTIHAKEDITKDDFEDIVNKAYDTYITEVLICELDY